MNSWKEIYAQVKATNPDLFFDCVAKASGIAHTHYFAEGKHDILSLGAAIEEALIEVAYKALNE